MPAIAQKIFLAEDDELLADGLVRTLSRAGYSVDWQANGAKAETLLAMRTYDLVILDLNLPGRTGFELLSYLRQRNDTPVLVLTAREGVEDRVNCLDGGADDYLAKPFDIQELEARVRALIRRSRGSASTEIEHGMLRFNTITRELIHGHESIELSPRERSLLEMLLGRCGRVVDKQALTAHVCSQEADVTPNAIEVCVHRLRKKLEPYGAVIRTARGLGYLLELPKNEP